ncbi:MAG: restriction endonuclease subunit S [Candidatus Pristimantibacillus sp.]
MSRVLLGDVAKERRETCKGSKDGYPIVGLEHLIPEEITLTVWDEGKENTFSKLFREGDILFGRRRAYLKKAAIAPFDGICSGDITVIEAIQERILPEMLPFIIQNDTLFDFAVGKSAGSLSPRVKWENLKNYEFELPDMDKQRELAKILWAIDTTKKTYQKLLQKTDELVKSQFIEMFGDPKSNPKGLVMKTIGDVCDFEGGSQPPRSTFIFEPKVDYVRLIQIRDYKSNEYITYIPEQLAKKFCDVDDIMIGRYGPPIFQILQGLEGAYNVALMKAVPKDKNIDKEFLRFYLKRDELLHHLEMFQQRTVGQAGIEMNELRNYPCLVPPMEEQKEFISFVRQSNKSKFELEQALKELDSTYKKIISENLG